MTKTEKLVARLKSIAEVYDELVVEDEAGCYDYYLGKSEAYLKAALMLEDALKEDKDDQG
jgi:hypothetical protein